jgi:flagellar basal-body rod protein FlgB
MLQTIELLQLAAERMRYLQQRQNLISQNIANVSTPGFRAQDLLPFRFPSALVASLVGDIDAPLHLATTSPLHLQPAEPSGAVQQASSSTEKPDGNTVSLEEQMVKLSDNSSAFDLASTAYSQTIGILKMAIGNP